MTVESTEVSTGSVASTDTGSRPGHVLDYRAEVRGRYGVFGIIGWILRGMGAAVFLVVIVMMIGSLIGMAAGGGSHQPIFSMIVVGGGWGGVVVTLLRWARAEQGEEGNFWLGVGYYVGAGVFVAGLVVASILARWG